jgi:putative addiction module component (TIGR02574 family)
MTKTADKLRTQVSALSFEDREEILEHLLELQGWEADEEWTAELDKRMEEVESGKDAGILVDEVFPELRENPERR